MECRLCRCENVSLRESHIVSKMFYNTLKKKSLTGIMRQNINPNKGVQDGLKTSLLCGRCEELLSKYETYFSDNIYLETVKKEGESCFNSRDDNMSYFLLSIAWRVMLYTLENDKTTFTVNEKNEVFKIIEKWRVILDTEDMNEIRKIQQFIIPTKNLKFFVGIERRIWDNIGIDFKTFDEKDTFKFAFTFVQVPYFIFITTVWGETNGMKQYKVGRMIKPHKSELPINISSLLENNHYNEYFKAQEKISEKQIKIIEKRIKNKNNEINDVSVSLIQNIYL